ncbi:MAG: sensor histidine kinase [Propioniciclava sp.]
MPHVGGVRMSPAFWFTAGAAALLFAASIALGAELIRTRSALHEAQSQALAAADAQHRTAEQAVAAERIRIVREMHDVMAHSLAIMIAQADGGSYVVSDQAVAKRAFLTIAETGRGALHDTRRILGILRHGEDSQGLQPVPADASTTTLVHRARAAGMTVSLVQLGQPQQLPAGSRMALYRICQESITNVLKHAGDAARTVITENWRETDVTLTVSNEGGDGPVADTDPLGGYGLGLLGMRERAELVGGTLTATTTPGGFRVQASLPLSTTTEEM